MLVLIIMAFAIGYLVGAKQEQKRLKPKEYTPEPEVVEQLQTLAGIKEHDRVKGSGELAQILDNLEKKKDAAATMFTSDNVAEFLKSNSFKHMKEVMDKSIEDTKRFNEVRVGYAKTQKKKSKSKLPNEIQKAMMEAPAATSNISNQFINQNRKEIEDNEAASILLTGETDAHYYYKETKDTKKK